jgi:hypothetical protein
MRNAWLGCLVVWCVLGAVGRPADSPALVNPVEAPGRAVAHGHSVVYPNLLIEVGQDFLNALADRTESRTGEINRREEKTHTVGVQTTTVRVQVDLLPSSQNALFSLILRGRTNAETDSRRGRIQVGHTTQVSYASQKTLVVDENGIRESASQTDPQLDYNCLKYLNADVCLPVRPMVKRIAYRVYNKQKPNLDAGILKSAREEVTKQFDELAAKQIHELNRRYIVDIKEPMVERRVFPQRLRLMTSDHQIGIRALLQDPLGKPMHFAPVPDVLGWPDLAVRIEQSLLNNFCQAMFGGKEFTGEELDDEFNRLIGPLLGEIKTADVGDKDFSITFAKERPIEFRFDEQKLTITLRGEDFTSGGRDFDGMDTTAVYKLRKTDKGLIAERQGDLVIYPPGFRPGVDRLGAREKVLQQILDRKFSRVFKPSFESQELKLPEKLKTDIALVTTQVDANKGWLTLAWRRSQK